MLKLSIGGGWAERRPEVLARNNFHRGNEFFKDGDFKAAIKHYRLALDKLKNKGHHDHILMPTALSNIACIDYAEGRVDDAKQLMSEVVELYKNLPHQQSDESEEKEAIGTQQQGEERVNLSVWSLRAAT